MMSSSTRRLPKTRAELSAQPKYSGTEFRPRFRRAVDTSRRTVRRVRRSVPGRGWTSIRRCCHGRQPPAAHKMLVSPTGNSPNPDRWPRVEPALPRRRDPQPHPADRCVGNRPGPTVLLPPRRAVLCRIRVPSERKDESPSAGVGHQLGEAAAPSAIVGGAAAEESMTLRSALAPPARGRGRRGPTAVSSTPCRPAAQRASRSHAA